MALLRCFSLTLPCLLAFGNSVGLAPAQAGGFQTGGGTLPAPPVITSFTAVAEGGNLWTFSGQVLDSGLTEVVVQFGNLPSLQGRSTLVDEDGFFSITIALAQGEAGIAIAQATDGFSQVSNKAQAPVFPAN
jgi:hypothetical protein